MSDVVYLVLQPTAGLQLLYSGKYLK